MTGFPLNLQGIMPAAEGLFSPAVSNADDASKQAVQCI
jgi:hypothetical protein